MKPQENPVTICQACHKPLPPGKLYFCPDECWLLVPAQDRVALYQMHARNQDTTTKVASLVRKVLKKRPGQRAWANPQPGPASPPESRALPGSSPDISCPP